jgi:hypothetical protein
LQHLRQCSDLFGTAHISDAPLGTVTQSGLLYMPASKDGAAGVFDLQGMAVPASVNFRGEGRLPIHQALQISPPTETDRHNGSLLIYVGAMFPHFGHFITTTMSRFWYLRHVEDRPVRLLCHNFGAISGLFGRPYVGDIFGALDIGPDDFVTFDRPTLIESEVVFPSPSFEENFGGNTAFLKCSRDVGSRLLDNAAVQTDRPLYLSKAKLP